MGCCYSLNRPASPSKTRLVDFTLVRSIGKGAFGKVCIVYNKSMKKHYALKYMSKRRLVSKLVAQNVIRELEILQELSHPFIVNLWFTFQDEEYIFMVSDLLLGGDLQYHLQNDGKFSEVRVKLYACEIALAIDYLQQRNIMHRDPANMVLDEKGHVHLTDFNLATKLEPNSLATAFCGTKPQMAPEILATHLNIIQGYGLWVDYWSLGVTFFELLRGRQPFDFSANSTPHQMLSLIMAEAYLIPSNWTSDLIAFVKALLHIDIDKRITTFEAFKKHRYMERMNFDAILNRQVSAAFIPKQNKLNCDPSYELEERILESSPLHQHYRKQHMQKKRNCNHSAVTSNDTATQSSHNVLLDEAIQELSNSFTEYNRFNSFAHRPLLDLNQTPTSSTDLPEHCPSTSNSNKYTLQKAKSVR